MKVICVCVCGEGAIIFCRLPRGLGFRHGTRQGVFSPSVSAVSVPLLVCSVTMLQAACMCWCMVLTQITINVK